MPSRDLTWKLGVVDGASDKFGKVAESAESTGARIGGAFSKAGNLIGGEIGEMVNKVGEGFEKIGEHGTSAFTKIAAGGAVVAGIGVAIQSMTSKSEAAEGQLKAAVDASGDSWDDYEKQVAKAEDTEAKYSHNAAETDQALQILVQATGSMKTALADLAVVTNLAAAKHISLADAATLVAKIYGGSSKTLKQFGVDMAVTAGNTDQATAAVGALGAKLEGQADAQANTFTGKLGAARTEVENFGDRVLAVAGGPLTALGGAVGLVTGVMEVGATVIDMVKGKHVENTIATAGEAAADDKLAASAALASGANEKLAASTEQVASRSKLASVGAFGFAGVLLAAAAAGGVLTEGLTGSMTQALISADNPAIGLGEDIGALSTKFVLAWKNGAALTKVLDNAGKTTGGFAAAIEGDGGKVGEVSTKFALAALQADGLGKAVAKSGVSLADLTTGVTGTNAEFAKLITRLEDSGKVGGNTVQAIMQLRKQFLDGQITADEYQKSLKDLGVTTDGAASALENLGTVSAGAAPEIHTLAKETDGLAAALDAIESPYLDAAGAQLQFQSGLQTLSTQIKSAKDDHDKYATSLDGSTESGNRNAQSILSLVQAAQKQAQQDIKNNKSVDDVTAAYGRNIDKIVATATQSGISQAAVDGYLTTLNATKGDFTATINANITPAMDALAVFKGQLASLSNNVITTGFTNVNGRAKPAAASYTGGFLKHADGGTINTINEEGGEILSLPNGTRALPHTQSVQLLRDAAAVNRGVGDIHFHISVSMLEPTQAAGRVIAKSIERHINDGNGIKGVTY